MPWEQFIITWNSLLCSKSNFWKFKPLPWTVKLRKSLTFHPFVTSLLLHFSRQFYFFLIWTICQNQAKVPSPYILSYQPRQVIGAVTTAITQRIVGRSIERRDIIEKKNQIIDRVNVVKLKHNETNFFKGFVSKMSIEFELFFPRDLLTTNKNE